ncbi:hypothetical protein C8J57DRAFT_1190237 [Mycena rebaudengoi]|nr:hypothetical protein C8J57DRAFT_1190237 [Mycena rebaudengoi]
MSSLLHLVPTTGKYLAFLLLLLNAGSLPGAWHLNLRVIFRVISLVLDRRLLQLRSLFWSEADKQKALAAWHEARLPIGEHPFRRSSSYKSWVGFDDADFNMHMSNSSYAKALDPARICFAVDTFPNLFRAGGWIPLAATHYHFLHEIPIFTRYEIRTTIGAWDDKWLWTIHRFVMRPSKKIKIKSNSMVDVIKSTPATGEDSKATPAFYGSTPSDSNDKFNSNTSAPEALGSALLAAAVREEEPDGGVLCTIVVSQLCFKQGRITIPPVVLLASNGFCAPPPPSTLNTCGSPVSSFVPGKTFLPTSLPSPNHHPPPSYISPSLTASIRAVSIPSAGGSPRSALAKFYAGGWRGVPPAERWWEHALSGLDGELQERLRPLGEAGLKGGLGEVVELR